MSSSFAKVVFPLAALPPQYLIWLWAALPGALMSSFGFYRRGPFTTSFVSFISILVRLPWKDSLRSRLSTEVSVAHRYTGTHTSTPVVMSPRAGAHASEPGARGDLCDPVRWLLPQSSVCPNTGFSVALSGGCIDLGNLWGIAQKAGTRDSTVVTSSFHNNQLNQDIIHAKPLAWVT